MFDIQKRSGFDKHDVIGVIIGFIIMSLITYAFFEYRENQLEIEKMCNSKVGITSPLDQFCCD